MGIFYNPPQPPTANNAGTPPEPHAPIGTQGSQPPRYSTVLMMAAVLASWPADLEPRLQAPNNQQNKIAPLTLTYGQQPPQRAPLAVLNQSTILATWQQTWDAQRAPKSLAWDVPISPYLARTPPPPLIWDAWIPPPPLPARPVQIAPLTLAYGSQPTPQPPLSTVELAQIVGAWQQTWDAQTAPKSAAWNVPPIVSTLVPRTPPPALIWTAWVEPFVRPPVPVAIAPLTLVYGDAPPIRGTSPLQAQLAAWADPWFVQAGPKTAAWNVPPIVAAIIPANAFPYQILRAWQDDPNRPPRLVTIAPLTLTYGSQPPVQAPLSAANRVAVQIWPPDLEPRLGRPNDQRVRIAPLTLVYGNPPAPHGPISPTLLSILARSWQPADPFPPPRGVFGQGTPPPTVFGGADLAIRDQVITAIAVGDVAIQLVDLAITDHVVTVITVGDTAVQLVGYVQQVIADGAVAYWRLGETSGTTAVDSVGGKNGTISGGVTLNQPGALADGNKAMLFDGATGKITVPAIVLDCGSATQSFSIEFWSNGPYTEGNSSLLTKGVSAYNGGGIGWELRHQGTGYWTFGRTNNGPATRLDNWSVPLSTWSHVVVTYNAATHVATAYVNGAAVKTLVLSGADIAAYTDTYPLLMATGTDGSTFATLDEVAIYPTALTALQIAAHYAAASPLVDLIVSDTEVTALTVTDTLLITS